jgi:hypothetical protein
VHVVVCADDLRPSRRGVVRHAHRLWQATQLLVWVKPPGDGSGTRTPTASLGGGFGEPLALTAHGQTLFAGSECSRLRRCIAVLHELWVTGTMSAATAQVPGPPQTEGLHAAGLTRGRPRIGLSVHTASGAATLVSIALTQPRGLRFTATRRALCRGVRMTGGHALSLRHGSLVLTLRTGARKIALTVTGPTVVEAPRLILIARRDRAHRRLLRLRIHAVVTDTAGDRTPTTLIYN